MMTTIIVRNSVVLLVTIAVLAIVLVDSRELRPSEHGLPFQDLSAKSPEMVSFFGEESKEPPSTSILNETASTDTWWRGTPAGKEENKVRKALVIATVVCGGTGLVLLLAAVFMFAVHFYRRRLLLLSSSDHNAIAANHSVTAAVIAANVPDHNK
ncbi:hypothetical protein BVRB_9g215840 [Beta vulgaris subsp. vulgaris]|nr:hypothetical protein BVRB_9g215840 [Beta vulgaris subsp. vulgaris]